MKKFTSLLTMAFIALMSFTLTSCDEDSDIAFTLDGTWEGNMYVEYGGYSAMRSVISFDQESLYSGTGYWVDYYDQDYWGGYDNIANHIRWTVRNGNIYIHLIEENSDVVIYDYSLNSSTFVGSVDSSNGNRAKFTLYNDSYSYNWRDNYWNWGYSSVDTTTDVGTISSRATSDSVKTEKPVRRFVVK